MTILNFLLGRSEFKSDREIINTIQVFERFNVQLEKLDSAEAILVFKSETQQAWLVFTSQRFYYVLDDIEEVKTVVSWARDRDKMLEGGRLTLHPKERSISKETGEVLFGKQNHGFMFTKSLFKGTSIGGQILHLANKHFSRESDC